MRLSMSKVMLPLSHLTRSSSANIGRRRSPWLLPICLLAMLMVVIHAAGVVQDSGVDEQYEQDELTLARTELNATTFLETDASVGLKMYSVHDSPAVWAERIQKRLQSIDFPFSYNGVAYSRAPAFIGDTPPLKGTLAYYDLVERASAYRSAPTPKDLSYRDSRPSLAGFKKIWGRWPTTALRRKKWYMEGEFGVGTPSQSVFLVVDTGEPKTWILDTSITRGPQINKFQSGSSGTLKRDGRLDDYIRTPHSNSMLKGILVSDTMEINHITHPRIDFILVNQDEHSSIPETFEHSGVLGLGTRWRPGAERGKGATQVPRHYHYFTRLTLAQSNVHFLTFNLFQQAPPTDCGCAAINPITGWSLAGSVCDFSFTAPDIPVAPMPQVMDVNDGWMPIQDLTKCPTFTNALTLGPAVLAAAPQLAAATARLPIGGGSGPVPKIRPCWCKKQHRGRAKTIVKLLITMPKWYFEPILIPTKHRRRLLALATQVEDESIRLDELGGVNSSLPLLTTFVEERAWIEGRILQRQALRESMKTAHEEYEKQRMKHNDDGSDEEPAPSSTEPSLQTSPNAFRPLANVPLTLESLLKDGALLHELNLEDPSKLLSMSDEEIDTIIDYAEAKRNEMQLHAQDEQASAPGSRYENSTESGSLKQQQPTDFVHALPEPDEHVVKHDQVEHHEALIHDLQMKHEQTRQQTALMESQSHQLDSRPKLPKPPGPKKSVQLPKAPEPLKGSPMASPPVKTSDVPYRDQVAVGKIVPTKPAEDPRKISVTAGDASVGNQGYIPTIMEMLPVASFYFQGDGGCYSAGHIDKRFYKGDITWIPASHSSASWTIPISDILVDGESSGVCAGGCLGGLSTGSTLIRGSFKLLGPIIEAAPIDPGCVPDSNKIVTFVLGNGMKVDLDGADQTQRTDDGSPRKKQDTENYKFTPDPLIDSSRGNDFCSSVFSSWSPPDYTDERVIILGTPFLQKFYTIFDFANSRIGLAQPRHEWYTVNGCAWEGGVLQPPGEPDDQEGDRYAWCRAPQECGGAGTNAGGGSSGFSGSGAVGVGIAGNPKPNPDFKQLPGELHLVAKLFRETQKTDGRSNAQMNLAKALIGPNAFSRQARIPSAADLNPKIRKQIKASKHLAQQAARRRRERKYHRPKPKPTPKTPPKKKPQVKQVEDWTLWVSPKAHPKYLPPSNVDTRPKFADPARQAAYVAEVAAKKAAAAAARAAAIKANQPVPEPEPEPVVEPSPEPEQPPVPIPEPTPEPLEPAPQKPFPATPKPIARRHIPPSIKAPSEEKFSIEKAEAELKLLVDEQKKYAAETKKRTPKPIPTPASAPIQPQPVPAPVPVPVPVPVPAPAAVRPPSRTWTPSVRPIIAGGPTKFEVSVHNEPDEDIRVRIPRNEPTEKQLRAAGMDTSRTIAYGPNGLPLAGRTRPVDPYDLRSYSVSDVIGNVGSRAETNRAVDSTIHDALNAIAGLAGPGSLDEHSLTLDDFPRSDNNYRSPSQPQRRVRDRDIPRVSEDPYHLHDSYSDHVLLAKGSQTQTTADQLAASDASKDQSLIQSLPSSSSLHDATLTQNLLPLASSPMTRLDQAKEVLKSMRHAAEARQQAELATQQATNSKSTDHTPPDDNALTFMPSWKKLLFRD